MKKYTVEGWLEISFILHFAPGLDRAGFSQKSDNPELSCWDTIIAADNNLESFVISENQSDEL